MRHGQPGWRQHAHLLKNVKELDRAIGRVARAKRQGADRLKPGYQRLLDLAEELVERARQLLRALAFRVDAEALAGLGAGFGGQEGELLHYLQLTEKVCGTARRRVLQGETVPNEEKVFSIGRDQIAKLRMPVAAIVDQERDHGASAFARA